MRTLWLLAFLAAGSALRSRTAEFPARRRRARRYHAPSEGAALRMSGYGGRVPGFEGIHDHLFVRAVVVDDGAQQGAVAIADLAEISTGFWEELASRIEKELGIPRRNVLAAATHTHAGPCTGALFRRPPGPQERGLCPGGPGQVCGGYPAGPREPGTGARRGGGGLGQRECQPARPQWPTGGLRLGRNPDGPSNKTVAVVKFETLAGEPIAVIMNYGVHCTVFGPKNFQISGDLGGAAARHVEERLGKRAVAVFSSGAAGDQAPHI